MQRPWLITYLKQPIDYANLLEKVMTNGTNDQKDKTHKSILDDLLSDGRSGIVGTYITSLIKRGEENIVFSPTEMVEFKNLNNIGLTESTKIMIYFINICLYLCHLHDSRNVRSSIKSNFWMVAANDNTGF